MASPGININFTDFGTDKLHPLGFKAEDANGGVWRYSYNAGAATLAVGKGVCQHTNGTAFNGSNTVATSLGTTLGTVPTCIGIAAAAVPTLNYCWLQIKGPNQMALVTDSGVVAGDFLVIDGGGTPSYQFDTLAAGEEHAAVGWVTSDDSGTSQPVYTAYLDIR